MPAISKSQQRLAAMALHAPEKIRKENVGIKKMAKSDLREFAETKRKGLPKKAPRRKGTFGV